MFNDIHYKLDIYIKYICIYIHLHNYNFCIFAIQFNVTA